jgi:hypothetical protein
MRAVLVVVQEELQVLEIQEVPELLQLQPSQVVVLAHLVGQVEALAPTEKLV